MENSNTANIPITKKYQISDTNSITTITEKRSPNKFMQCYLLGILVGKCSFNFKYKKLRLTLPLNKKHIMQALKDNFGGSIYEDEGWLNTGAILRYEITGKKDLRALRKVVKKYYKRIGDELSPILEFLNTI